MPFRYVVFPAAERNHYEHPTGGKHLVIFKSNKKIKTYYLNKLNLFGVTQFKGIRRWIITFLCRLRDQSFHRKCNFLVNKDKSKLCSVVWHQKGCSGLCRGSRAEVKLRYSPGEPPCSLCRAPRLLPCCGAASALFRNQFCRNQFCFSDASVLNVFM